MQSIEIRLKAIVSILQYYDAKKVAIVPEFWYLAVSYMSNKAI